MYDFLSVLILFFIKIFYIDNIIKKVGCVVLSIYLSIYIYIYIYMYIIYILYIYIYIFNDAMVRNKKTSKKWKFCPLQVIQFSLKLVWIVFISSSYDSITSLHVITESYIILAKYFPFLQISVLGHIWCFLHSHQHFLLFHHWFDLHFVSSNLHLLCMIILIN